MTIINKSIWEVLLITGLLCIAQTGWCETSQGDFFLSPMFGGHVFEGNQNIDDGPTFGLGLGYQFTDHWGTEAFFNYTKTDSDPGSNDVDVFPMHLDVVYNIFPDQKCVPYVAAGLGAIVFDPDGPEDSDVDFMANYGAGIKYFVHDAIALRLDVRHLISSDDTQSNLLYTAGLMFNFAAAKPALAQVVDIDSDGDGVMDSQDKCPGTLVGTRVDTFGCALAMPKADSDRDGVFDDDDACPGTPMDVSVDAKGCPLDSDGDGVMDSQDKCPGTPAGTPVDASGCVLDSDGDGVADYKDGCPNTPKGAHVDARGCWFVRGALFDTDKATIQNSYIQELDNIAVVMNHNPGLRFEIQGHSDNVGSVAYNQRLSEKRANAVMGYLLKQGISSDRLTSKGFGFTKPAATNTSAEGRALNRRVEINPLF